MSQSGYVIDKSLKDGDLCFQGPLVIFTGKMTKSLFTGAIDKTVEVHPWHPALPAVARWLAELGPYAVQGLIAMEAFVDDTQPDVDTLMGGVRDGLEALRSLVVALTGGEGAGGD